MKKVISTGLVLLGTVILALPATGADDGKTGPAHHHVHGSATGSVDIAALPASETLRVDACWIRLLPVPAPSAGYFVVENADSKPVKLVAASASGFDMVMLHQTTHHEGMSRMSMAEDIDIPASGSLEFKPGGYHAMLEQPAPEVQVGSSVTMDFQFDNGEKSTATCEVKAAGTIQHKH